MTADAQAVAVKNIQGLAWHIAMKSDRIVLDMCWTVVQYVVNFDPGTKKSKSDTEIDTDIGNEDSPETMQKKNVCPQNENIASDPSADITDTAKISADDSKSGVESKQDDNDSESKPGGDDCLCDDKQQEVEMKDSGDGDKK